jgi:hypothetical protein
MDKKIANHNDSSPLRRGAGLPAEAVSALAGGEVRIENVRED